MTREAMASDSDHGSRITNHDPAGIIFDLDGVLIDSEGLQYLSYSRVLEPFGVRVSRAEYGREWIGAGRGPEYAVRTYNLPISAERLKQLKNPVYSEMLRAEIRLMPGVIDALERLVCDFPLAVATNSMADDVEFVLQRFGLGDFFSAVVVREDYLGAKPEPDAFITAAARLALPPQRCVVIEDAYKGVAAAHRAGCKCIAVPNDFTRENDFGLADTVVDSLDEITPKMIRKLISV